MRRVIFLFSAALLAAAGPASAADMVYPGGSALTETVKGQPLWTIQARCAGLFGATTAVLTERGDTAGAARAKARAVAFHNDAVDRLVKDRGLARDVAKENVARLLLASREEGLRQIGDDGLDDLSRWNVARSVCLDVDEVYGRLR